MGRKAYNALSIANQLNKNNSEIQVNIFLIADGVNCVVAGQKTPNGYYNIDINTLSKSVKEYVQAEQKLKEYFYCTR